MTGLAVSAFCGQLFVAQAQEASDRGQSASALSLSLIDGRLTVEAEDVPLRDLLQALGERSGFGVELRGEVGGTVSPSIVDLPLHQALAELLGSERLSFMLEFAPDPSGERSNRLAKLTVMAPGGRPRPAKETPRQRTIDIEQPGPAGLSPGDARREAIQVLDEILREEQDPEAREAVAEALRELEAMATDM